MNLNDLFNEEKVRLDPKCWTGKKIGNPKTKMKGGVRVNNCVPAESVEETRRGQVPMTLKPGETDNLEPEDFAGFKKLPAYQQGFQAQQRAGKQLIQKSPYTFQSDQDWAYRQGATDAQRAGMFANFGGTKPLTTTEDSLEEVDRRGFLKGLGVAGAAGAVGFAGGVKKKQNDHVAQQYGILNGFNGQINGKDKRSYDFLISQNKKNAYFEKRLDKDIMFHSRYDYGLSNGERIFQNNFPNGLTSTNDWERFYQIHSILQNNFEDAAISVMEESVQQGMDEGEQQKGADYRDPKEVDYDGEYDAMVARVKRLAGLGPLKTVYDPNKRVYRNMPTAVQPKK
jgi:hypothetical protein